MWQSSVMDTPAFIAPLLRHVDKKQLFVAFRLIRFGEGMLFVRIPLGFEMFRLNGFENMSAIKYHFVNPLRAYKKLITKQCHSSISIHFLSKIA